HVRRGGVQRPVRNAGGPRFRLEILKPGLKTLAAVAGACLRKSCAWKKTNGQSQARDDSHVHSIRPFGESREFDAALWQVKDDQMISVSWARIKITSWRNRDSSSAR